ncbi:MAG TPA: hypothetical protein PKZ76_08670 [Xanthomonadaceae bacterium]|nr:hypothetical protein [Xanthomonadaceae bacterium]
MPEIYTTIVTAHIAAGAVALLTYWIAALARKGSPIHRAAGKLFLLAMLAIIVTSIPMTVWQFARGNPIGAAFLGFLVVLVSSACWSAWFAIRYKRQPACFYGRTQLVLGMACLISGGAVSVLGFSVGSMLLGLFGLIGVAVGVETWRAQRRDSHPANWWLREHYGAMIGNGVATHIAFLGIGLRGLLPGQDWAVLQYGAWFGPVLVAIVAGIWLDRRYSRPRSATHTVRAHG